MAAQQGEQARFTFSSGAPVGDKTSKIGSVHKKPVEPLSKDWEKNESPLALAPEPR